MPRTIVIVAAGDPDLARVAVGDPDSYIDSFVIAVDGGAALAGEMGWPISLAVGDFDSLEPAAVTELHRSGAEIRRFAADKDATDLELALDAARALDAAAARTVVVGIEGGRPDHALAALALCCRPRYAALGIEIRLMAGTAWPIHTERTWDLAPGTVLSVIPLLGDAVVSIAGARWPLTRYRIEAGTTQGVSNEALGGPVALTVHDGVVIAMVPLR